MRENRRSAGIHAAEYLRAGVAEQTTGYPGIARSDFQKAITVDPLFWKARVALASLNRIIQNSETETRNSGHAKHANGDESQGINGGPNEVRFINSDASVRQRAGIAFKFRLRNLLNVTDKGSVAGSSIPGRLAGADGSVKGLLDFFESLAFRLRQHEHGD